MGSTRQAWDISKSELLQSLGEADIDSIGASRNPLLSKAYKLRRLKIAELEGRIKSLLDSPTIDGKIRSTVTRLSRELKAVVLTDPTEAFKFDVNNKKAIKGILDTKGWKYTIPDWYIAVGDEQAHHKAGLDKYYKGVIGKSDADLYFLHRDLAKNNTYLGNHPKNRQILHISTHQGNPRRAGRVIDSVHGILDWSAVDSNDFERIMEQVDPRDQTTDFGKGNLKRIPTPEPGETGYTSRQIIDLARNDYEISDQVSQRIPETGVLWERDIPKKDDTILRAFVEKYPQDQWPEGTRELLSKGDSTSILKVADIIDAKNKVSIQQRFINTFGENSVVRQKLSAAQEELNKLNAQSLFSVGVPTAILADIIKGAKGLAAGITPDVRDALNPEHAVNLAQAQRRISEGENPFNVIKEEGGESLGVLKQDLFDNAKWASALMLASKIPGGANLASGGARILANPIVGVPLLTTGAANFANTYLEEKRDGYGLYDQAADFFHQDPIENEEGETIGYEKREEVEKRKWEGDTGLKHYFANRNKNR